MTVRNIFRYNCDGNQFAELAISPSRQIASRTSDVKAEYPASGQE